MKKIIVVLGMHRSGTSAITRGLNVLGAEFGPELMPAQKSDNEKGFWEDLGTYQINEKILEKIGSRWDGWSRIHLDEKQLSLLTEEKQAALALLKERTAQHPIYAFKDPRTSVLLPFWQWVFKSLKDTQIHYLLAIRTPMSVAASLHKRNGFPEKKSYVLWLKHNYAVLSTLHREDVTVLDYDRLMSAPEKAITRLADAFDIPRSAIDDGALVEYVQNFLTHDLRHSEFDVDDAAQLDDLPLAGHLYANLYRLSKDEAVKNQTETLLSSIQSYFTEQHTLFKHIDAIEKDNAAYYRVVERVESKHDFLHKKYEALKTKHSALTADYEALKTKHSALTADYNFNVETLKQVYSRLHAFDRSLLGRWQALSEKIYCVLKFSPSASSHYRQLIDEANNYLSEHKVDPSEYAPPHGRVRLMIRVVAYTFRHPYSSLRLLSFYRFKKLIKTLFSSDQSQANSWVEERFPNVARTQQISLIAEDESLDSLKLAFEEVDTPLVSIVIPVFNQYRTTISCLKAVLEHTEDIEYEVIIGDDASTDITDTIESRVNNVKIVRAKQNQGFLKNCNDAVAQARGQYVVLLNNDTNVQPGWLSALTKTLHKRPDVGLVGPKLLFEDGKLQEAGGIVWKDGSGWNYGRGQDANQPEFNYLRETDYISGACIMFRKNDWDDLGGFDETFCPAYYEDTDLAFQMRQKGLKVIYQPKSAVVHFEGVSNGTDVGSGVKKHQVTNQKKFIQKWRDVLEKEHYPNAENVFQARERSSGKRTVVIIDHYVPFYDKDAGSRSTWLYIKAMIDAGLNIKFLPANFYPHQPYTSELQQLGVEVLFGENYARNWKKWFRDNAKYIDVIYMHRPHITEDFIGDLTQLKPQPKLVYFGHDLHYLRTQRESELREDPALMEQSEDWKKREFRIFEQVDKVLYPSVVETEAVKRESPQLDVSPIPLYLLNAPGPDSYQHQTRQDLLFVGGFGHPPNEDAVIWFVEQIFPRVLEKSPDVKFHVVGSQVPDSIKSLQSQNVLIHGFLSDEALEDLYRAVRAVVVPLRFGAGVKGKVLEALQAGLPIVTTSIGAEGIPEADSVMVIQDDVNKLVDELISIYTDERRCMHYLNQYPGYIEKHFSHSAVDKIIQQNFIN